VVFEKEQLNKAEAALWRIFNIVNSIPSSRRSKILLEIRQIISNYVDERVNEKIEKVKND